MDEDLMEILVCPVCKGDLELRVAERAKDGDIVSGALRCTECPYDYPIEDGIPNLLPPELQTADKE